MWIKQLHLKDFQAYKDQTINLHPNVNAVVGTGNSGKSSIVRALSFILFGKWDSSWVRHGAKSAKIEIITDSGIVITREKGPKVNKYVVQEPGKKEQVYESFGKTIPEEIIKITKIFKVNIGDKEELNLNLANQLDQLFLLSNTGSFKAKVLGNLSKAHYLDYALRELNKEKKKFTNEKNFLEAETKSIEEELKGFVGLDKNKTSLDSIKLRLQKIESLNTRLIDLKELSSETSVWKEKYVQRKTELESITKIQIPDIVVLETSLKILSELADMKGQLQYCYDKSITVNTNLKDTTKEISELINSYVRLLKDNNKCPTCFGEITSDCVDQVMALL